MTRIRLGTLTNHVVSILIPDQSLERVYSIGARTRELLADNGTLLRRSMLNALLDHVGSKLVLGKRENLA